MTKVNPRPVVNPGLHKVKLMYVPCILYRGILIFQSITLNIAFIRNYEYNTYSL